ncbi:MAG: septum formation inhibitor Maf [Verrucomicrobia bacterium]|nr:septum formation inhibitor Maf [Verrucomicrobiota bacterium]
MKLKINFAAIILALFFSGTIQQRAFGEESVSDYWSSGLAEISRYELKQARYGAIHSGDAILLFVTEPFSASAQVKDDSGRDPSAVPVLKLNAFKRFETGVYDYSIMTSVFSRMDDKKSLPTFKVTTSVQDWCGQVFNQWNQRDQLWETELRSYFQSDGDVDLELPLVPHEDGIWNRLRLNPDSLPTENFEMIPSSAFLRLKHQAIQPYAVTAKLSSVSKGRRTYSLTYPDLNRSLEIEFEAKAPYEIIGWSESYPDRGDKILTTTARRTHQLRSYYWEQNQPSHLKLRKKLGLN